MKGIVSRLALLFGLVIVVLVGVRILINNQFIFKTTPTNDTLKVTTSFYPLQYLVEQIGGNYVMITNLTPVGSEPHDFEPSAADMIHLASQDMIVLNGGGLEGYVEKVRTNSKSTKTTVLVAGERYMSDPKDPHVWLDPLLYQKEGELIASALMKKDPAHASYYQSRFKALSDTLSELDQEFSKTLSSCDQHAIITSHAAFGYLAKRYGMRQVALAGLSPDQEPSTKTLIDVASFAKSRKIRHIFFEELVSPRIADTIAHEVGAQTLVLNPIEGLTDDQKRSGENYVTLQRKNLKNLQVALSCK